MLTVEAASTQSLRVTLSIIRVVLKSWEVTHMEWEKSTELGDV